MSDPTVTGVLRATPAPATLAAWVAEPRARTLALVADAAERFPVPYLGIVNPTLREIGHVALFQDFRVLKVAVAPEFDSAQIDHRAGWDLPLARDRGLQDLDPDPDPRTACFVVLSQDKS